ncbi:hypothetical protein [Ichthyenterobacterium magnum]|uniref:SpoIIAA-like protein n=1 Tax=Ichthyenterobacterium magnum TaxID=1230530 RepID=A0A420DMM0_9FLAO|nr:hypothetical protein [Ichthyenterobacterium magnum]RKE95450.1 hypothetical protein BXY80_1640 [Ichthyenterobacterium magnum]
MTDVLKYNFCEMHIYDNYMIVIINEGETITPEHNAVLLNIVDTYYKNKKFVYITHRVHSYAVDPAIYFETSKIKNLAGFCVVSSDFKAKRNAEIEKLFLNKPFEIFTELDDAISWTKSILNIEFN